MSPFRSLRSLCVVVLLLAAGCAADDSTLGFEEFEARAYREPETGAYVINGDELAETTEELRAAYDRYETEQQQAETGIARSEHGLAVNVVKGRDDKWSSAQAQNLTYCVSKASFGARYADVVQAMSAAAGAWEGAGRVNFVHDVARDGNCNARTDVVFDVRQVCTGRYLARAFFPSTSRRNRNVLIDCTSFGDIKPYSLAGILRHELGHALGFRHEHTRPEAGTCYEDSSWRALTQYDSSSVMHYPQCNGTNNGDLVLTSLDKQGAAALYP